MISTFNAQEVLNKWTGRHTTEERAKNTKNDQILHLHKSLAPFLQKNLFQSFLRFILFWEPHNPTAYWASSNIDSNTYIHIARMQKAFPTARWINELLPI